MNIIRNCIIHKMIRYVTIYRSLPTVTLWVIWLFLFLSNLKKLWGAQNVLFSFQHIATWIQFKIYLSLLMFHNSMRFQWPELCLLYHSLLFYHSKILEHPMWTENWIKLWMIEMCVVFDRVNCYNIVVIVI